MKIKTSDFKKPCGCRSVGDCFHNLFIEWKALEYLSDSINKQMKKKLKIKYLEGYRGWDDEKNFPIQELKKQFMDHLLKGFDEDNMIDIINLAAMIWNRL